MVGLSRLELLTSRLSGVRSNQLSYRPIIRRKSKIFASNFVMSSNSAVDVPLYDSLEFAVIPCYTSKLLLSTTYIGLHPIRKNGGDEENRTPDPLLARQVLSQLSYAPIL